MGTYPVQALIFDGLMVNTATPALQSWQLIYDQYEQSHDFQQWQHAVGSAADCDPLTHLAALVAQQHPARPFDTAVGQQREARKHRLNAALPLLPSGLAMLRAAATLRLPCHAGPNAVPHHSTLRPSPSKGDRRSRFRICFSGSKPSRHRLPCSHQAG